MAIQDINQSAYSVAVSTGSTGYTAVENIRGFSFTETAGSTSATVYIYEGTTSASTMLLWPVAIGANESVLYESNVRRELTGGAYVVVSGTTGLDGGLLI